MTPRSQKSGYGLILGYRSGLDGGREKNFFLAMLMFKNTIGIGQKPGKSSSDGRARYRNRSGVVEAVRREPLMFAKVENGVTKSCQNFRRKNRKNAFWFLWAPDFFRFFWAGSLVVRESRDRRDRFSDKNSQQRRREKMCLIFFSKWAYPWLLLKKKLLPRKN